MADILFIDSFDTYTTVQISRKWEDMTASGFAIGTGGRNSTNALLVSSGIEQYVAKYITATDTIIVGFAIKATALPVSTNEETFLSLVEASSLHVRVAVTSSGAVKLYRSAPGNDVHVGTTSPGGLISTTAFTYVEIKIVIDDSAGSWEIRKDGGTSAFHSDSGLDTMNDNTGVIEKVCIGTVNDSLTTLGCIIDDLYILKPAGSGTYSTFLGDCRVEVLKVSGAGDSAQWTPSTGSNYENVDDITSDDDGTYNSDSVSGQKDTFALGNLVSTSGTVFCVAANSVMRKADAGNTQVQNVVRHSTSEGTGATFAISTTYINYQDIFQDNPSTSASWTGSEVNSMEGGYKIP